MIVNQVYLQKLDQYDIQASQSKVKSGNQTFRNLIDII